MFIKLHFSFQNSNNHDLGLQSDAAVKNCKKLYILLHLLYSFCTLRSHD